MRHVCKGKHEPVRELCRQFNRETKDGKDMRHYSELLQQAINSIIEVKAESDIDSLFSPGETTALQGITSVSGSISNISWTTYPSQLEFGKKVVPSFS